MSVRKRSAKVAMAMDNKCTNENSENVDATRRNDANFTVTSLCARPLLRSTRKRPRNVASLNDEQDIDGSSESGRNVNVRESVNGKTTATTTVTTKRPCLNKNALMARENRQRKKEYIERLESKLLLFKRENEHLSNAIRRRDIDLKRLKAEVSYLRNVIGNSSSIVSLLRSMNDSLSAVKNEDRERRKNLSKNSSFYDRERENRSADEDDEILLARNWVCDDNDFQQCLTTVGGKRRLASEDSDHAYASSKYGSFDEDASSLEQRCSYKNPTDNENFKDDNYDDIFPDLDAVSSLDRSSDFDKNIFESAATFATAFNDEDNDAATASIQLDKFDESTNRLLENLGDGGICLHVNSGRISLEFCSICRLNSINSSE